MTERRRLDAMVTQHIWDAIKLIVSQRNLPNQERLVKYIARVYQIPEHRVQEDLDKAVADRLMDVKKGTGKNGTEVESYRLPTETKIDDDHDWYCYKCQKSGVVECCQKCHRVFHSKCHTPANMELKYCRFCEKICSDQFGKNVDLNHILNFTCGHLKAKLPPEITNRTIISDDAPVVTPPGGFSGPTWISVGEDAWRPGILIKNHMDLAIMEKKTKRNEYTNLSEFEADAHNIMHNIIIYHGANSTIGEMGITMYQDCCYDLQEIRRCVDCYRLSNEKLEKMWFCTPCNPPHQLVYAKQKGYPYWPAKVMQINGDVYDVRFFGGHHMRANIEKVFIRPITVNLNSLQIKRSTAWNKAFEELKHHRNLLARLEKSLAKRSSIKDEEDSAKPAKIRHVESPKSNVSVNSGLNKNLNIFKDLRVKVERMNTDGKLDTQSTSTEIEEKAMTSKTRSGSDDRNSSAGSRKTSEERQVPILPVAEEEPATETSNTCPQGLKKEGSQEDMVTSSCQEPRSKCVLVQTEPVQSEVLPAKVKRGRRTSDQPTTTVLDKLRREMELDKCKEMERLQAEHAKEVRQLIDKHQQLVSEIKKKQWCYNCEAEAIYHCCWNTAYCSIGCQQLHWQSEHKRVCRRKR